MKPKSVFALRASKGGKFHLVECIIKTAKKGGNQFLEATGVTRFGTKTNGVPESELPPLEDFTINGETIKVAKLPTTPLSDEAEQLLKGIKDDMVGKQSMTYSGVNVTMHCRFMHLAKRGLIRVSLTTKPGVRVVHLF